eukprot:NODE_24_length_4294_cov_22.270439_g22_i0.p1 GENE.NODE_24_length_4294_cov_22.270439_g22_i0~~NODE_24_length_4294_cov_22.270439_g22_i0.p1  ORF type:complete len:1341 (+),score=223.88 NODE_24_length_4294_cov_22.270439_g22_i0:89-4111(+)
MAEEEQRAVRLLEQAKRVITKQPAPVNTELREARQLLLEVEMVPSKSRNVFVQRVWYNLIGKLWACGEFQDTLESSRHTYAKLFEIAVQSGQVTNDCEALLPVPGLDKDVCTLAAWASCFESRCLAELHPEMAVAHVINRSLHWVKYFMQQNCAKEAAMLASYCLQALFKAARPGGSHLGFSEMDKVLLLLQVPKLTSVAPKIMSSACVWAVFLLSSGMKALTDHTSEFGHNLLTSTELATLIPAFTFRSAKPKVYYQHVAIAFSVMHLVLTTTGQPLPELAVSRLSSVLSLCAWLRCTHLWLYGLRLLCAHYRRACAMTPETSKLRNRCELVHRLSELCRLLVQLGHPQMAAKVQSEAAGVVEQLTPEGGEISPAVRLCVWHASIAYSYVAFEKGKLEGALAEVTDTYLDICNYELQFRVATAEDRQMQGRLQLACTYSLSMMYFRSGALDRALPLAEDCLSCSPFCVGSTPPSSLITFSPKAFAEYAEVFEVFLHLITLQLARGCVKDAQGYADSARKLCSRGMSTGSWVLSPHYMLSLTLLTQRIHKMNGEYEEARKQLRAIPHLVSMSTPVGAMGPPMAPCAVKQADPEDGLPPPRDAESLTYHNVNLPVYFRYLLEAGDLLMATSNPVEALKWYRLAAIAAEALAPVPYLALLCDMDNYTGTTRHKGQLDFDTFNLPMGPIGRYSLVDTVNIYIGRAMLDIPESSTEGLQLLDKSVQAVQDLTLDKSLGYYSLGMAHWDPTAVMRSWSQSAIDNPNSMLPTSLLESYRHQRHLLSVPETRRICLALGNSSERSDAAYFLNMALGNTLRHQLCETAGAITVRELLEPHGNAQTPPASQADILLAAKAVCMPPTTESARFMAELSEQLPDSMAVCTLCVAKGGQHLLVVRLEQGAAPSITALPLLRNGCESENMLQSACSELMEILQESRNICMSHELHPEPSTRKERRTWWESRRGLDARLGHMLNNLQKELLPHGRKGLLLGNFTDTKTRSMFEALVDRVYGQLQVTEECTLGTGATLDKGLLRAALLGLSADIQDGCANVSAFADDVSGLVDVPSLSKPLCEVVKGVYVELKKLLIESPCVDRQHVVLILDGICQPLPWESLPVLSSHSVSRVPSLYYLQIQLAKYQKKAPSSLLRDGIDSTSVFYVLNPTTDLVKTQARFQPWFERQENWTGTIGAAPTKDEFRSALEDKDMFLYFGHGNGEKFVSKARLRSMTQCGVVLLVGCSSGKLETVAELDPAGAPLNYLLAGSPCVVSNLWDVTDVDIDTLTERTLRAWLDQDPTEYNTTSACLHSTGMLLAASLPSVLPKVRTRCKLRYLTAAATVCYGLPVFLKG